MPDWLVPILQILGIAMIVFILWMTIILLPKILTSNSSGKAKKFAASHKWTLGIGACAAILLLLFTVPLFFNGEGSEKGGESFKSAVDIPSGYGLTGCTRSLLLNGAEAPCWMPGYPSSNKRAYPYPKTPMSVWVPPPSENGGWSDVYLMRRPSNGTAWVSCISPLPEDSNTGKENFEVWHAGPSFGTRWKWEMGSGDTRPVTTIQFRNLTEQGDYVILWFIPAGGTCKL